ncbi:MAG: GNAT family N-acetyltransferase [Scrofimicrobium sp.]
MQFDDIVLSKPTLDDVPAMYAIYSDPRVWGHLPTGRHTEISQTREMVQNWIDWWDRDGLSTWVIRDADTNEVLGHVGCYVKHDAFWNLGYRLAFEAQGRGIASRVSEVAVREARRLKPQLPVVAYLLEHNLASARVAEKTGLTLQHRGPDAGNPNPDAIRLIYADRPLTNDQLEKALI